MSRIAGHFFRYLWLAFAVLVILYAIFVVAARELMPVANRYQPEISRFLSDITGLDVDIGGIGGAWRASTPLVDLRRVTIAGRGGNGPALTVDRLSAELNLVRSIAGGTPVWRELTADTMGIELVEDERGRWTLAGYPLGLTTGGNNLQYLFDLLFYSRYLRIDELVVDLVFYAGTSARFHVRDVQVENAGGFHRALASIALSGEGKSAADFVFEGRGDPADAGDFTGRGYLHLRRLNMEGSLKSLVSAWFPELTEQMGRVETKLDFSFWFDWKNRALRNGRGNLQAAEIPLLFLPEAPVMKNTRAEVTGWFHPGEDWGFRVQDLRGSLAGEVIEPVNLQFRQRVGRNWGDLDLAVNRLDLETAAATLRNTALLGEEGESVLSTLGPEGELRQLFLDVNFSREKPVFQVRANVRDLSLNAWRGAPAVQGLSGYIESGVERGFVVIDSPDGLALHYPQAYDDFMHYGRTRGKVAWRWLPEEDRVTVTTNRIQIDGDEGEGTVFLHLDLPTVKGGNPEMDLMVGMRNSHVRHVDNYLPTVLKPELRQFLRRALVDGAVPEAGFIWRGSLKKAFHNGRSIQVYARLKDGVVDYRQGWPAAREVDASLVVDNTEMDVRVEDARLAGETVDRLSVNVRRRPTGPLLRIVGNMDTSVSRSFEVLSRSPLQNRLADVTGLKAEGRVDIGLDLRIPLSGQRELEEYRVRARLSDATLAIPGTGFEIDAISGLVKYSLGEGLGSETLQGNLWNRPLSATISSEADRIIVRGEGLFGADGARALLDGLHTFVEGETAVEAELSLSLASEEPHLLTLSSDLTGLRVSLPAPFDKDKEAELPSRAVLEIQSGNIRVNGNAGEKLAVAGLVKNGELVRGSMELLGETAELPQQDLFLVTGRLTAADWSDWQDLLDQQDFSTSGAMTKTGNVHLDLTLEDLVVRGLPLETTRLKGQRVRDEGWRFQLSSPRVEGNVLLPEDASPPRLDLDYLRLPSLKQTASAGGENGKEAGLLDRVSPLDVPELDVAIRQLIYNDRPVGNISFETRRLPRGVVFDGIEGRLNNIGIAPRVLSSEEEEVDAAQLQWTVTESGNSSFFSGTLEIDDIEAVLRQWDIPAPLTSESSNFYVNLGWDGKPWQVNTLGLDGYLGIEFHDGQFYEKNVGAANAFLKLVGLINFDTWLRRLRFDFSDFFSEGLSYDQLEGGLVFRRGLVDFDDPIEADMPSGKVHLSGTVDLIYEQLDARLVATMPVGTNLPWVAGLLGGLPAAAGVFLTSKLFEKQVDQLSSIGYKVTGPLEDPKIEVQRIFSDPTRLSNDEDATGDE